MMLGAILFLLPFLAVATPPPAGNRLPGTGGLPSFFLGLNYPWKDYGRDFGTNIWGYDGVASKVSTVTSDFGNIQGYGAKIVRWWVFGDLRAGILFDSNGNPTGVDGKVLGDLDAAVSIAKAQGILLVPGRFFCWKFKLKRTVLFDFGMLYNAQTVTGVQLGGRTNLISNPAMNALLISNVINPILQR